MIAHTSCAKVILKKRKLLSFHLLQEVLIFGPQKNHAATVREFVTIFTTKLWLFDSKILQVLTNGSHVRSMVEVPLVALVALMPSQRWQVISWT